MMSDKDNQPPLPFSSPFPPFVPSVPMPMQLPGLLPYSFIPTIPNSQLSSTSGFSYSNMIQQMTGAPMMYPGSYYVMPFMWTLPTPIVKEEVDEIVVEDSRSTNNAMQRRIKFSIDEILSTDQELNEVSDEPLDITKSSNSTNITFVDESDSSKGSILQISVPPSIPSSNVSLSSSLPYPSPTISTNNSLCDTMSTEPILSSIQPKMEMIDGCVVDPIESTTVDVPIVSNESEDEETIDDDKEEEEEGQMNDTPSIVDNESMNAPPIPRRFGPIQRIVYENKQKKKEKKERKKRDESHSPIRWESSPSISEDEEVMNEDDHTLIIQHLPLNMKIGDVRQYFGSKYGRVYVNRCKSTPTIARITFDSSRCRQRALAMGKHIVQKRSLILFKSLSELRESKRLRDMKKASVTKESQSCSMTKHSPIRMPSIEDVQSIEKKKNIHLNTLGFYRGANSKARIILTAGPIPSECDMEKVMNYFIQKNCSVYSTIPSDDSYIVLSFQSEQDAKAVLVSIEHRVDGHLIPVTPPYEVRLNLYQWNHQATNDLIQYVHNKFGPLVTDPYIVLNDNNRHYGCLIFARPSDAQSVIRIYNHNVNGRRCQMMESKKNLSFLPFKTIWDAKCVLNPPMEDCTHPSISRNVRDNEIPRNRPILTVGPIPENLYNECIDYLIKTFGEVYSTPFNMTESKYLLLSPNEINVVLQLLIDDYIQCGDKKIPVSPSFDVIFYIDPCKERRSALVPDRLIQTMHKHYGPIVRSPFIDGDCIILTFGRVKDAIRVIHNSPLFRNKDIIAECPRPNRSFSFFSDIFDPHILIGNAKAANRSVEASNIVIKCNGDDSDEKRSVITIEDEEEQLRVQALQSRKRGGKDEDKVMEKKMKNMDRNRCTIRLICTDGALPSKRNLYHYFQRFGQIKNYEYCSRYEGMLTFASPSQTEYALQQRKIRIGHSCIKLDYC